MCVHGECMCMCVHISVGTSIDQKRASDSTELELQAIVSYLMWVLETELLCFERATSALKG